MPNHPYLWTLEDYQRFLHHPDSLIRFWALRRLEEQYPEQAANFAVTLLDDEDALLAVSAIKAAGEVGGTVYEQQLLDRLPTMQGQKRKWASHALGQMRSLAFLPLLLEEVNQLDLHKPQEGFWAVDFSQLNALGEYDNVQAKAALWKIVQIYAWDDHFMQYAYQALLRHAEVDTLPALVRRLFQLKLPKTMQVSATGRALANAVGLEQLFADLADTLDPFQLFGELEGWADVEVLPTPRLEAAFQAYNHNSASKDDNKLVRIALDEFARLASERGDDLAQWLNEWQADTKPAGYRWRALASWQIINTLNELAVRQLAHHHKIEMRNLALLLLGQYLLDEDDEASLAAAATPEERQAGLRHILASPRQNVLAGIEAEATALGPPLIPVLVDLLEDSNYWPNLRALHVLTRIARAHPGAAEAAIPAILDLLETDESDFTNAACEEALRAIGPAVLEPIRARLDPENSTFEIYATSVLSNIPTQATVDALERYAASKEILEEWDAENLTSLGHIQSLAFLRRYYQAGDERLATCLYTIGLLHNVDDPALTTWGKLAHEVEDRSQKLLNGDASPTLFSQSSGLRSSKGELGLAEPNKVTLEARKSRKKKRTQAKATQKAQRKVAKKKKKRR